MDKRKMVAKYNEEALIPDGFESAIIGVSFNFGKEPVAAISYSKCIDILMSRDNMTQEEAVEFFEFNVLGYGGGDTPSFVFEF